MKMVNFTFQHLDTGERFPDSHCIGGQLVSRKKCHYHFHKNHLSRSWKGWNNFRPCHPIYLRSVLILSSHLRLGFSTGLFPKGFSQQIPAHIFVNVHATCPVHLEWDCDNENIAAYHYHRVIIKRFAVFFSVYTVLIFVHPILEVGSP
jgi:hypothetical protein